MRSKAKSVRGARQSAFLVAVCGRRSGRLGTTNFMIRGGVGGERILRLRVRKGTPSLWDRKGVP